MSIPVRRILLAVLTLLASVAQAHVASTGFLTLRVEARSVTGTLELAVRDLELAVGLDTDGDGKITWAELRAGEPLARRYVAQQLALTSGSSSCNLEFQGLKVNQRVDGVYAWMPFAARCAAAPKDLFIRYDVLRDLDPSHRGLVTLVSNEATQTGVLTPGTQAARFSLSTFSVWRAIAEYFHAGVLHIWSGIDHLLFLLSLLLPAVLIRREREWAPVARAQPAIANIVRVVTAFTLAHSITLTLAALDLVHLPARLTESVIAGSIVVAALNNVFPVITESRARIAFAFGLLHGFGFASVLADMGLPAGARLSSLVAFNLGIEAGQLAVVLLVMPAIYALRSMRVYRRALMPWGSAAIAALALVWLVQRAILAGG